MSVTNNPQEVLPGRKTVYLVPALCYLALAVIFLVSILAQVFLAGAGIFDQAAWLRVHEIFGHSITYIPLFMLIPGLIARLPSNVNWQTLVMFILTFIQPVLLHLPKRLGVPVLSALHPVNALLIFVLSLYLLYRVIVILRERQDKNGKAIR